VARLRRSDLRRPGLSRRRAGKGWTYLDAGGERITDRETLDRIRALAIPPAYTDVWISPHPYGHIQAVGTDAAGRRQYRYHELWQHRRAQAKHLRVLQVGEKLPAMRRRWVRDLRRDTLDRRRVLAAAARLLDLGLFRVGGEEYAEEHGTYGLATLRRDHVTIQPGRLVFDYTAKGGLRRQEIVEDPEVARVVAALQGRADDPNPELFAYRDGESWNDVKSGAVNEYLREVSGLDMSAKDFRTWHATVLMAAILARAAVPSGKRARDRTVRAGYVEVSEALGNTPAVCKASYVDPRVVDLYHDGTVIALPPRRRSDQAMRSALEREVLDLLYVEPD
jgi:DNA topoisomerase I